MLLLLGHLGICTCKYDLDVTNLINLLLVYIKFYLAVNIVIKPTDDFLLWKTKKYEYFKNRQSPIYHINSLNSKKKS